MQKITGKISSYHILAKKITRNQLSGLKSKWVEEEIISLRLIFSAARPVHPTFPQQPALLVQAMKLDYA